MPTGEPGRCVSKDTARFACEFCTFGDVATRHGMQADLSDSVERVTYCRAIVHVFTVRQDCVNTRLAIKDCV